MVMNQHYWQNIWGRVVASDVVKADYGDAEIKQGVLADL